MPMCFSMEKSLCPLYVVPTERTDDTEAYGLKLLKFTDRIDAARHTAEGTEIIACLASQAIISVDSCLANYKQRSYKQRNYKYKRVRLYVLRYHRKSV